MLSQMYIGPHVMCPLFLSYSTETCIFSTGFRKNTYIPNFIKIRPVGAELFHADGQTDVPKLIIAFRTFANTPKIQKHLDLQ